MACNIYILSCPIGAVGDECTFEIDCCGGQTINYTMQPDNIIEACVNPQGTVTVTSLSGSASNTFDPCSSDCGDIPVVPSPSPSPAPSPTPTPTPTPAGACQCYQLLYEDTGTATINYTACGGGGSSIVIDPLTFYYICSTTTPTTSDPAVTIAAFGSPGGCTTNTDCDPNPPSPAPTPTPATPSPTPSPSPTPTPVPTAPSPAPSTPAPVPSSTPTPTSIQCTFWELICGSSGGCTFSYVDCNAVTQTINLGADQNAEVCVLQYTTPQLLSGSGTSQDTEVDCTVAPSPTPTAPAPTPTPTPSVPACTEWELSCGSTGSCNYDYINCNGTLISGVIPADRDITICVQSGTIPNITGGGKSNTTVACGATPTPTTPYSYQEYSKCNESTTKQVFYAPIGYVFPLVVVYQDQCYENPQPTGVTTGANILGLTQYNNCAECLNENPNPNVCLGFTNTVAIVNPGTGNQYQFNGVTGNPYGTTTGTYKLLSVPSAHPIAILNYGKTSLISYTGTVNAGTGTAPDGRTYNFYSGDVTITVSGDYQTVSYACLYHGYMGGQDNLGFNSTVCSIPPAPTPTPGTAPTPTPGSVVPPIPSPVKTEYTLTYSQTSKGWPSFYSYIPDYMLGMNQYFYTFNGGNLYQHNANGNRNNFYGEQYNSQITTVFNQNPLDNKIFKTINLESDQAWQANLETDIQINGFIDNTWFEKKEGSYFAYLRQTGEVPALSGQYAMRSANGIGKSTTYTITGNTTTIFFSTNPIVEIGNIVSIGDYLYFSLPSYTTINLAGQVTNINIDIPAGINQISVDTSISGSVPMTIGDPFILYIKSSEAESHGLLGHYCIFTLINESPLATELFAVESEVMKSYP
jgi:hypothetical protein